MIYGNPLCVVKQPLRHHIAGKNGSKSEKNNNAGAALEQAGQGAFEERSANNSEELGKEPPRTREQWKKFETD